LPTTFENPRFFYRARKAFRSYPFMVAVRLGFDAVTQMALTRFWTLLFRLRCRVHGITCGHNVEVFGRVIIRAPAGGIAISNNVQLISSSWRATAGALNHPVRLRTFRPGARIIIDEGAGLNGTSITCRSRTIRIGSGTMVGPNCALVDSDFHVPWPPSRRNDGTTESDSDVLIGRNVWIGANCLILKGVTIGDNSVIGAGSVVVRSVPANTLAAGNPAKVLKHYETP
jgi:acetyltransferase-like isoleucine patch superfamily enzyme